MIDEDAKEKILSLRKRYEELDQRLTFNVKFVFDMPAIELIWDSGIECTEVDLISEREVWKKINSEIKSLSKHKKSFDKKIKRFVKDCDKLAKELGFDHKEFFDNYIQSKELL
jgi:hypothetical protein